ncbi:MAG: Snf7 family protein [Thermoproteota archaeon]|nr:Snf7 family protein [Thermoproteota archaeon]
MSFSTKWIKPQAESVGIKIMENIKPQPPLKPRIEEAQKKLQMQIAKLDSISIKTEEKDQLVFKRVIQAVQNHESQYAKVLSGELAQIRKMNKMVNSAKLALEQIQLRLNTITELGDVVVTLSPAMSVIKGIQSGLSSMMPEADHSLSQISDMLGGILTDSAQIPAAELNNTKVMTEDSLKIIEEATAIVEQSMKEKFPDLPSIGLGSKDAEATLY